MELAAGINGTISLFVIAGARYFLTMQFYAVIMQQYAVVCCIILTMYLYVFECSFMQ